MHCYFSEGIAFSLFSSTLRSLYLPFLEYSTLIYLLWTSLIALTTARRVFTDFRCRLHLSQNNFGPRLQKLWQGFPGHLHIIGSASYGGSVPFTSLSSYSSFSSSFDLRSCYTSQPLKVIHPAPEPLLPHLAIFGESRSSSVESCPS